MLRNPLIIVVSLFVATSSLVAQEPSSPTSMQEAMRLMMPSDGHAMFAKLAGKWTTKTKIWNSALPNQPPMESTGESETKLIFGGRYLVEEARGSVMRMPMQRLSILGYDNFQKVYTQVFFSNLETATNIATGSFDSAGKVLTVRGEFVEPQGRTPFKNVLYLEGDVHRFESYKVLPNGAELKVVEEISTRMK